MELAERIGRRFHEAYEQLAPQHGYEARNVMVAVTEALLREGAIEPGPAIRVSTFPGKPAVPLAGQTELEDAGRG